MHTFKTSILIEAKITVPDTTLADLRRMATDDPKTEGGDPYLHELQERYPNDDDTFLNLALKNALRNIARNGIVTDIGSMGVGVRAAPAQVEVSVPERIVTKIAAGIQRVSLDELADAQSVQVHPDY